MRITMVSGALAISVALASSVIARAAGLTNGSFESGTYTLGGDGSTSVNPGDTTITGWTVITNIVAPIATPNIYSIVPEDGDVILDLQGYTDSAPYGGVSQDITTVASENYDLNFWIGVQNNVSYAVGPASIQATAGGTSQTFTNSLSGPNNQWEEFTLPFTAAGTDTTITLQGISTGGGAYIGLDNVTVTDLGPSGVPEPASVACVLAGLAPLALRRRRRRA